MRRWPVQLNSYGLREGAPVRISGRNRSWLAAPVTALLPLLVQGLAHAVRPEREYNDTPSKHGLAFEAVNFRTSDGALLSGWFFPVSGDSARGTVVISGTDAGNMSYLISYAAFFAENHFKRTPLRLSRLRCEPGILEHPRCFDLPRVSDRPDGRN
jgi:hypothetical protein